MMRALNTMCPTSFHIVPGLKYIVLTGESNGLGSSNNVATPFHSSGRRKFRPCGLQTLHPLSHRPRRDLVSLRGRLEQEASGGRSRWMSCLTNPRRIPAVRPPLRGAASESGSDGVPGCPSPELTPKDDEGADMCVRGCLRGGTSAPGGSLSTPRVKLSDPRSGRPAPKVKSVTLGAACPTHGSARLTHGAS